MQYNLVCEVDCILRIKGNSDFQASLLQIHRVPSATCDSALDRAILS